MQPMTTGYTNKQPPTWQSYLNLSIDLPQVSSTAWPLPTDQQSRVGTQPREGVGVVNLAAFVEQTTQITLEPWQHMICDRLARLPDETGQRILIHGPPQAGKSIIISQRFPAWMLGRKPLGRIRLACYNLTHAERFSKVNLAVMRGAEYRASFPDPDAQIPERCPADEWSTTARAALNDANPSFKALGLDGGFTGLGVDTMIIDD